MEKSFEVDGPVKADIEIPAGDIEVAPSDGNHVTVLLEAVRGSRRAEELMEDAEVSCSGNTLRVHVPERAFRNVDVRCRLGLPEGSSLTTKTASADVRSSITLAAFDGSTASGDAELRGVTGDVRHKSASGDLSCESVGGTLRVRTASGDVSVERAIGDVSLALASGDTRIEDAEGSVEVKSASGDVRLGCVRRGRATAQTASGDVRIGVADGVGAYLDVTTVSGDTNCALPFEERSPGGDTVLEIVARTVSGDIVVEKAGR
jgi:DUF4097 and DUF4098 domain-containing protein YvlB